MIVRDTVQMPCLIKPAHIQDFALLLVTGDGGALYVTIISWRHDLLAVSCVKSKTRSLPSPTKTALARSESTISQMRQPPTSSGNY